MYIILEIHSVKNKSNIRINVFISFMDKFVILVAHRSPFLLHSVMTLTPYYMNLTTANNFKIMPNNISVLL